MNSITKCLLSLLATSLLASATPNLKWASHDRTRPAPQLVTPAIVSTPEKVGTAPSDAVVLFDGKSLDTFVAMDGTPTQWVIKNGALECVPQSGYIRTKQSFGDCQLHIEWASPAEVKGKSQGRGNSGVFFAINRYEIQVLDSYQNETYADGSAGSLYGQYPPLVNASRPSGEWQTYDIIYQAPRFADCGELESPAVITVLHNGVLIQNNSELTGPTAWIGRPPYSKHPVKQPIGLQDHGNPVRYRNIWIRELGEKTKPEFYLANKVLESYVGKYTREHGGTIEVSNGENGTLNLKISDTTLEMFAESDTRFFAKTTDVICEFSVKGEEKCLKVSVGDDRWMKATAE